MGLRPSAVAAAADAVSVGKFVDGALDSGADRVAGLPLGCLLLVTVVRDGCSTTTSALGLTGVAGHTADMHHDEKAPVGFTLGDTALEPPEPESIETAFADAGLGVGIADLREARTETSDQAGRRVRLC